MLSDEKNMQKEGKYQRADLLKMHAYKDAIRRTAGAYILYPGEKTLIKEGFHEIVPGLGAFPVSPSNVEEGISSLKKFILEILDHFSNRASQREEMSYNLYNIHKNKKNNGKIFEKIPEYYSVKNKLGSEVKERSAPPKKDMNVLVGYYKKEQYEWIKKHGLYNIRINKYENKYKSYKANSMKAHYLILHGKGEKKTGKIWKIIDPTPVIMSREELIDKDYPGTPTKDFYLVYSITSLDTNNFDSEKWDVRKLPGFGKAHASTHPFIVSFEELMKVCVNK
ncbi:MAG: nuclease domain-containing protein [Candidatus Aenigmatarchaeota archaeon]